MGVCVGDEVLFRSEKQKGRTGFIPVTLLEDYIQEIRQDLVEKATAAATALPDATMAALAHHLTQISIFSSDLGRNTPQVVNSVEWIVSNIHPFFAYMYIYRD